MENLHKELRFAAICTILLDILLWLVSLFVTGAGIAVPVGLLLGSAGMLCNLLLLRRTIRNAVYYGKTKDLIGYLLRVLIASAVIAAGLLFCRSCTRRSFSGFWRSKRRNLIRTEGCNS